MTGAQIAVQYARDVVAGELSANKNVAYACERFVRELDEGLKRYRFDEDRANRAIDFLEALRHSKGEWRGKHLILEPWQKFIIANAFGWVYKSSGLRRFGTVYCELPRKNGKSTLAAGIGLYGLAADSEGAPEIYTAATSREQAKIVFGECTRMIKVCPELAKRITIYHGKLVIDNQDALLAPVHSKSENLDGLNTHIGIVDEYHEHKSSGVYEKISTSSGSRRQPLMWIITTAGRNQQSACYKERQYAVQVLSGKAQNDNYFAFIAGMDENDDWRDPATWRKANPNYGVSVHEEFLKKEYRKAVNSVTAQVSFQRYYLNKWTNEETKWLRIDDWNRNHKEEISPEFLKGRKCFGGLDLARVKDLSSFELFFPPEKKGDPGIVVSHFYCPSADIQRRSEVDRVPYKEWSQQGYIKVTDGNTTDFGFIAQDILKASEAYDLQGVAFDRTFAGELIQTLMDEGVNMVAFAQSYMAMGGPVREVERMVTGEELEHLAHPVLSWCAENAVISVDSNDNPKIDKQRSYERVDGMVALAMAVGLYITSDPDDGESVYEQRGMIAW